MSRTVPVKRCRHCQRRRPAILDTDGNGRVVDLTPPCLCPGGRKAAGICRDCPAPVQGTVGKALRCARCKRAAGNASSRRWRERNPDRVRETQDRQNAQRRTPEGRARCREREREYRNRPEVKERRRQQRRRAAIAHPERKREAQRRYRERYPERVQAQQRRQNETCREARRAYQHRHATKYVGPGRKPRCRKCGDEVPWSGHGRPRLECQRCDPERWRRDQRGKGGGGTDSQSEVEGC